MNRIALRVPAPATIVATLALFVALTGPAWPHGGDVLKVHGCVLSEFTSDRTANVRIVGANASCPTGSTPVDWVIDADPRPDTIRTEHIIDQAIRTNDIAPGSIMSSLLADRSVAASHVLNGVIDSGHVRDESLAAVDIAANSIGQQELAPGSVSSSKIATGAVSSGAILNSSVSGSDIAGQTITGYNLANNSVRGDQHIVNGTVSSVDILDNSVAGADIAKKQILSDHVVDGQLTGADVKDGSLKSQDLWLSITVITKHAIGKSNGLGMTAACPKGWRMTGGGARIDSGEGEVKKSYPTGPSLNAWEAWAGPTAASPDPWLFKVFAFCLKI